MSDTEWYIALMQVVASGLAGILAGVLIVWHVMK